MTNDNVASLTTSNSRVFEPANVCIYCGSKDGLTREHVIPYSLGGGMVLPKASCTACSRITAQVEEKCVKQNFRNIRTHMKLPTRRKKTRTTHLPLFVGGVRKMVPIAEHPGVLGLPVFWKPPGIFLVDEPPGRVAISGFITSSSAANEARTAALHGKDLQTETHFDIDAFIRLLAKIGHGIIAGEHGIENFDPFLPPLILGKKLDNAGFYIGGPSPNALPVPDNSQNLHRFGSHAAVQDGKEYAVVTIILFEALRGQRYEVVVGELKPGAVRS